MSNTVYSQLLKKLEKNLTKYSVLFALVFIVFVVISIYQIQTQKLNSYKKDVAHLIETSFKFAEKNTLNSLSLSLKRIIHNKKIIKLFNEQKRELLYLSVEDDFNFIIQNNIFVKVLHFHNADGTSFLRMHKSSKHSDNIALLRPMLKEIHKNHKRLVGYETGHYSTALRIIEPIFYNNKYIGALEIGIHPDFILDYIKNTIEEEGFFFVDKTKFMTNTDSFDFELNNMVIEYINDEKRLNILQKIPKEFNFKNKTVIEVNYKTYYLIPMNIFDFKGNSPAKILFVKDISEFTDEQKAIDIVVFIVLSSIILLLFYFAKKYIRYFENTLNSFFTNIISSEKDKKNYLQAIENSSSNFSITIDEENIISINKAALNFFSYQDIESFKIKHSCISDFFIKKDDFIQKYMGKLKWLDYILQNDNISHKALMKKDEKEYTFLIKVQNFIYKNKKRYLITLADITELEALNKNFQYIIKRNNFAEKGANIGLWDWDLRNDTVFYSDIWKSILGYKTEEIGDELHQWHKKIHPDDVEEVISKLDEHFINKNNYFVNHHRLLHKNGKYIHTICRGQAIFKNGIPIRMVGIYTDITKEHEAIDKIKEQEEMIIAQSRHAAMGEMISMIAHQWRQPIAIIAMGVNNILIDMELDTINNEDLEKECNEILDQTKYLSNTIDDFRNFFKQDKEKVLISVESVIEDALKLMNKSLSNNNISVLTTYFHTNKIKSLPREILQILLNIIKNAKEVLIEKKVENKFIKIYTTEDDNYIYIDIEDNGGGITKENIHKIFQPYFTTKDEHNGTGLGLYMSKTVAQKHLNGNLNVKNSLHGAIFTLSMKKKTT